MVLFSSSSRSVYVDKQQLPFGESMQIIILFPLLLLLILLLPFSVINLVEQQQQQKESRVPYGNLYLSRFNKNK